jgi:hypothetical protein
VIELVEQISDIKNQILEKMQQTVDERGIERMDVAEIGKLSDAVKDMAEAEKSCWESEYYRAVTEAMEDGSMGYEDGMSYAQGNQQGNQQGGRGYGRGRGGRRGYRGQPRDSMGRYTRRGYRGRYGHDDMMQDIKDMLMSADPQEKEQLKQKLRQMADM